MDESLSPGKWLKMRRKTLDMTQGQLARAVPCSVETIRKIESDGLHPSKQLAELLAACLGVPPEDRATFVRFMRGGVSPAAQSLSGAHFSPRPTNLRPAATPFIGREREVSEVRELLGRREVRLLTLSGPPGIGKTRLSIEAASSIDGFPDGVFFVPLASVRDPYLVPPTIASVLGLREAGSRPIQEILEQYLQTRNMLLVLDNFEQVLEAGPLIAGLLPAAPNLKIIVSSRAVLRVYSEHNFTVPPMSLPRPEGEDESIEQLSSYEAVRLFAARAQATKPDFAVTGANIRQIIELCALLDGLPLAIELAASRVRTLSLHDLLSRLNRRLDLLGAGMKDLPARQQTIRDAIAWSDDLLAERDRAVFHRFSVFAGGSTLEAAEAVCSNEVDLLSVFESLIDKSLLRRDDSEDETRFWVLDTIRDFAHEKLEESGHGQAARLAHGLYYMALAEQAESQLQGSGQAWWLSRLESDLNNLRAAMRNALDSREVEIAARLGSALRRFWYLHGHLSEGSRWLQEIVERGSTLPPDLRAKALHALGTLAWSQGRYPVARSMFTEGLSIWRDLDDKHGVADMLNNLAVAALPHGDMDEAYALHEEALGLFRQLGDHWSEAMSLANLGLVAMNRGEYDAAESLLGQSLRIRRNLGDKQTVAQSLNNLGTVMRLKGDYDVAYDLHSEALSAFRELDDRWSMALSYTNLGTVSAGRGEYDVSGELFRQALEAFKELDVKQGIATCLEGLAGVAARTGKPDRAARLFGAAEALREEIGVPIPPAEQADYEANLAIARGEAVQSRFASSWMMGRSMSQADAVRLALEG